MPSAHSTQPYLQGLQTSKPLYAAPSPGQLSSFPGKTKLVLLLLLPSPFSLAAPAAQTLPYSKTPFPKPVYIQMSKKLSISCVAVAKLKSHFESL